VSEAPPATRVARHIRSTAETGDPRSVIERVYCSWFPVAVVLLGLALRARQYFYNRSLWPDEIAVTDDIAHGSFRGLMHTQPNGQAAPIGWFWAERVAIDIFGLQEFALRLTPFIASIVALLLFPYVGRRLVGRWAMPLALLIFATSPQLLYYSSEVKQYGSDVACALVIVAITLVVSERAPSWRLAAWWLLLASCVIWFSQPGILLTAGCGVVLFLRWFRRPRGLLWVAAAGVAPLVVLAVDYFSALKDQSKSTLLQDYWVGGYPPKPYGLHSSTQWLWHDSGELLLDPGRLTHPVIVFVLGAVGIAVLLTRRKWRWATVMLVFPFVLAVAVAVLRVYPLRQRLGLYLLPFVFMLMCAPLRAVGSSFRPKLPRIAKGAVAVAVLAAVVVSGWPGFSRGVRVLGEPLEHTGGRQLTAYIAHNIKPGDVVYREFPWAAVSWDFYAARHPELPKPGSFVFVSTPTCVGVPSVAALTPGTRVWVFFDSRGSIEPKDAEAVFLSYFTSVGKVLAHKDVPHAQGAVYLMQITGSGPPPLPSWVPHGCLKVSPP
jgi:hypothetical protein